MLRRDFFCAMVRYRLDTFVKVAGILRTFFLPDSCCNSPSPLDAKTATAFCNTSILKIPVANSWGLGHRPDCKRMILEVRTTDEKDY
jgi:hypothetical protein